jgi:hypothetical protein
VPSLYNFEWGYYGVYSADLSSDIQQAVGLSLIEEDKQVDSYNNVKYEIKLKDRQDIEFSPLSPKALAFLNEIETLDVKILEVISSIVYFKNKGYDRAKIDALLMAYKGHLSSFFDESFQKTDELTASLR